jgi:hypothetical protein
MRMRRMTRMATMTRGIWPATSTRSTWWSTGKRQTPRSARYLTAPRRLCLWPYNHTPGPGPGPGPSSSPVLHSLGVCAAVLTFNAM